jgi:hypothetical protein
MNKKSNQIKYIFLKKPKPVQTDQFRLSFFRIKTGLAGLTQFFSVFFSFGLAFLFSGLQNQTG